ncbi:MAG: VWA domain-containing protein, partial [Saprospiraceae bacterium]
PSHLICSIPVYTYHEGIFEIPTILVGLSIKKDSSRASFFSTFRRGILETAPIELEVVAMAKQDDPYPPLNGKEIFVEVIDTALYRGQIKLDLTITGLGDPLFYTPPKFGLEKVARIQLDEITEEITRFPNEQNNKKTFDYTINFLEEGEFEIHPEWVTWNTGQKSWDTIYAKPQKILVPSKVVNPLSKEEKVSVVEPEIPIPHDIIFVMDLSSSMLTQDFSPSRIGFIKERLKHFIKNETDLQRYGIVAFAGKTGIVCPLTPDVEIINQALDQIEIGKLPDGTSIGDGLMHSLEVLSHSKALRRTIVLLTDGDQNSGKFDPLFSAKVARQKWVRIVSLGVGTKNNEAMVPVSKKANGDYRYALAKNNKIDDEILRAITAKTNGTYLRVLEPSKFDENLKQVLNTRNGLIPMVESPIDERLLNIYFKRFQWRNEILIF